MIDLTTRAFLDGLSDEAVEYLVERKKKKVDRPQLLPTPGFSDLIRIITAGVEASIEAGYEDDNFREYVYEAAMEAVYGKGYFPWRNAQKWG